MDVASKRIVVMGLGRFGGGVGVARYLARRGAQVLVTDLAGPAQLRESLAKLAGLPIQFRLGEHRESDFTSADLIVVNPAVRPDDNRYLLAAAEAGVPTTSEIRLLVERLPDRRRVMAVTGAAGKSTVAAMIAHLLRKAVGEQRVHLGGNIGGSLLEQVDTFAPGHYIVLEVSSFMLEGLDRERWSPGVAVVTNIAPNHLDWHGSLERYAAAKQTILRHQQPGDSAILGSTSVADWPTNPGVRRLELTNDDYDIALTIPGRHNRRNAMAALTAVEVLAPPPSPSQQAPGMGWGEGPAPDVLAPMSTPSSCPPLTRRRGIQASPTLADFPGLPHRLQFVCERANVRYFNDSKATTPDAAILALRSFDAGIVHAILGGSDKGSDLDAMARFAARHCRAVYTIGVTGDRIADAADLAAPQDANSAEVVRCHTLNEAVAQTVRRVHDGDIVLLSPGCASLDQFENYEKRGAAFAQAVLQCTGEGAARPIRMGD